MTHPALDFLAGDRSTATLDALEEGFLRWAGQDSYERSKLLNHYIGLDPSPGRLREHLRNTYLRQAAAHFHESDTYERAKALAAAARTFELRRWPLWFRMSEPPAHASPVDRCLWHARRHDEIPETPKHLHKIIL